MASEWIKWVKGLVNRREVVAMSMKILQGMDRQHARMTTACACMMFWEWADSETTDGHLPGVDLAFLDALVGIDGFGKSLEEQRWVRSKDNGITIANWEKHHSGSAKRRAYEQRKKSNQRERLADVPESDESDGDKSGTPTGPPLVSLSSSSLPSLLPEDAGARKSERSARERAERVWAVCTWRKVSKRAGIMAIQTAEKRLVSEVFKGDTDAASEFLRARAAAYAASRIAATTPMQFLPHPSTWFNQGRYDDDPREWDRARTGADADQIPIGGSTMDVMLANMGVDNGQTANGRHGEVSRGAIPALESDP